MRLDIWAAACVFALAAFPASAQSGAQRMERLEQALNEVLEQRYEPTEGRTFAETTRIDYGVYTTVSEIWTDAANGDTRQLTQVDARFWIQAQSGGHTGFARARLLYQWFDEGDSWWSEDEGFRYPIMDRWWYAFNSRRHAQATTGTSPDIAFDTRIGRQLITWGTGLSLYRTLYAARIALDTSATRVEAMVGVTPSADFVDFDGTRPGYTSDTDRTFWGVIADYRNWINHRPFIAFLQQIDNNDTTLPGGGRYEYNSSYASLGSTGQITSLVFYRAEVIYEFGDSISDLLGSFPQTQDDISAWALKLEFIYTPRPLTSLEDFRFEFEVLLGTGDSDRGHSAHTIDGNRSGTNDNAFNSFGFYNTGLVLGLDISNLVSVRIGPRWRPASRTSAGSKFSLGFDFYFFAKLDSDAPISVISVPGESYVGFETDLIATWQITSDLALDGRYGIFIPGDAFPGSQALHFLYLGFSYGF